MNPQELVICYGKALLIKVLAERVGFEPTEHLTMLNGFQVLRRSCYLVRLVLSCAVLSSVSCCLVRLVSSCIVQF